MFDGALALTKNKNDSWKKGIFTLVIHNKRSFYIGTSGNKTAQEGTNARI